MPDGVPKPIPATPAEVAAAILDRVEQYPESFDMESWAHFSYDQGETLTPDAAPLCGTTLCAAGWAAHVTGWTIVNPENWEAEGPVMITGADGTASPETVRVYAQKGDVCRLLTAVARDALGLQQSETFWFDSHHTALYRLREIAGRDDDVPEAHMNLDAGTGHGAYEYR